MAEKHLHDLESSAQLLAGSAKVNKGKNNTGSLYDAGDRDDIVASPRLNQQPEQANVWIYK